MKTDYLFNAYLLTMFIMTGAIHSRGTTTKCIEDDVIENITESEGAKTGRACTAEHWCERRSLLPGEKTAPKPRLRKLHYFVYKSKKTGRRNIGLKIRWSSVATHYEKYITGYAAALHTPGQLHSFRICFNLNKEKSTKDLPKSETTIKFLYRYKCDKHCVPILPGKVYLIELQSTPVYHKNGEPMVEIRHLTIPGCEDKTIRRAEACRGSRRRNRIRRKNSQKNSQPGISNTNSTNSTTETVSSTTTDLFDPTRVNDGIKKEHLIILGLTACVLLVLVVVITWITLRSINPKQDDIATKNVLFLERTGDASNPLYSVAFQWIISEIKRRGHVGVKYNKWETLELAKNPMKWTNEAIDAADAVVLLGTPPEYKKSPKRTILENDSKPHADDWLCTKFFEMSERMKDKRFCLIFFHCGKRYAEFDDLELSRSRNVQKYQMMENFNEFYKAISGDKKNGAKLSKDHQLHSMVKFIREERRVSNIAGETDPANEGGDRVTSILRHTNERLELGHGGARRKVRGQ